MSRGVVVRILLSSVAAALAFCSDPAMAQKPSFGSFLNRKTVSLVRKLPPVTDIKGKTISVQVAPGSPAEAGAAAELRGSIENRLTSTGSGVRVEANNPDLIVECTITHYTSPHHVTYTGSDNKVHSRLEADMNAVFRISEPRTHHLLASGVASSTPTENDTTAPLLSNPFAAKDRKKYTTDDEALLVNDVAGQIASYLVVTSESVTAMLAVDKEMDNADKLAVSNLWSRALESYSTTPKYSDDKLDAYRLYNVGVANEALAYQSTDPVVTLKYLQEASVDYGKALNDNPAEKYFMEPQNRIKRGLAHYTSGTDTRPDEAAAPAKADEVLTNDDVIAMSQAKLDNSLIVQSINGSAKVNFIFTSSALITLSKGGVNKDVINAMMAKQNAMPKK